jgi:hypothetical protein
LNTFAYFDDFVAAARLRYDIGGILIIDGEGEDGGG